MCICVYIYICIYIYIYIYVYSYIHTPYGHCRTYCTSGGIGWQGIGSLCKEAPMSQHCALSSSALPCALLI